MRVRGGSRGEGADWVTADVGRSSRVTGQRDYCRRNRFCRDLFFDMVALRMYNSTHCDCALAGPTIALLETDDRFHSLALSKFSQHGEDDSGEELCSVY